MGLSKPPLSPSLSKEGNCELPSSNEEGLGVVAPRASAIGQL